jgi:diguanylate cyclase (GGDEF)-like protein
MINFSMGRLEVRSSIRRRDEIGRLAEAFNQMADQHQQTHLRIVRLNAELEERVAYRTHQLRELASRDPLTGLYNRRHFSDVLERRFAEAVRYRTDLSCIMIDLDDFKSANDAFGHQVGDQVLQLAAGTIVGQLRASDVAARYGGDEFILLLPQTDADRAQVLGARVIERFNDELLARFPKSAVRMSMGIASLHSLTTATAEGLIQAADHALYMAKTAGKNRIVMAAPAA